MLRRFALALAVLFFAQPMSAQAQVLKHRKQKDSHPSVVHIHHTTVEPVVTPVYHVEPVVAYQPVLPLYQASYAPAVQLPSVVNQPVASVVTVPAMPSVVAAIEAAPANQIPVRTPALVPARQLGGEIRLTNPRENEGTLYFTLNDVAYAINPGEAKAVQVDRDWIIKFDNGNRKQLVYGLTAGAYEFTVSETTGWDLVKRTNNVSSTTSALGSNTIPRRAAVAVLTDVPASVQ